MAGAAAGGIAGGMIFFMLLIGSAILGLYAGAYAAHVFLVAIDGTAAGFDEVAWPDEPYFDWVWKLFYLAWLVAVWGVPLLFYGRHQLHTQTTPVALTHIVVAAVVAVWLLFPVSMLSSMGAPSRWVILYPPLLPRLLRRSGSLIAFYLVSGPVLAAGGLSLAAMLFVGPLPMVAAGACGLALVLLAYARLFGRLAHALRDAGPAPAKKPKARPKRRPSPAVEAAAYDPLAAGRAFVQPEDLPPVNAPNPDARVGYNVRFDAPAEPVRPAARRPVDLADGQYDVADAAPEVASARGPLPESWRNPSQYEMELASGTRNKQSGPGGVFDFPFRTANRGVVAWLTFLFTLAGTFMRLAIGNVLR